MDIKKIQPLLRAKGIPVSDDDFILNLLSLYEVAFDDMLDGTLDDVIEQSTDFKKFNIKKMQSVLLSKNIRIGDDDPIFTMLGLNEIVLNNVATVHRQRLKREHVQRLSIESVKREKYIIYTTCLVISIMAFFGGQEIEWLRQSVIGIGGMLLGSIICLMLPKENTSNNGNPVKSDSVTQIKSVSWTVTEFDQIAGMTKLSKRTLVACRDILIDKTNFETAAVKHNINESQLMRGLSELEEKREMRG